MNQVIVSGRLTKDPDVRYNDSGLAVARFSIAINRGKDKNGNDKGADFPSIVAFGVTAENIQKYCHKGNKVDVLGKIQTGSYTKQDGTKVYTTDIVANIVEFNFEKAADVEPDGEPQGLEGFQEIDGDLPF